MGILKTPQTLANISATVITLVNYPPPWILVAKKNKQMVGSSKKRLVLSQKGYADPPPLPSVLHL